MTAPAIHPGEHLAEELTELKMSAAALARMLKVPTNRITEVLNGKRAITGDTALRLGHFFGTSAEFWLNLQKLYELRLAEKKAGKMMQALPTLENAGGISRMNLIEAVPEAKAFIQSVLYAPKKYFLFKNEPFERFEAGVFSTSTVDSHNDQISREAIEDMAEQFRQNPIWMNVQHDPRIHPIGRVLTAEAFYDKTSNTYFLAGVYGYFDPDKLPRLGKLASNMAIGFDDDLLLFPAGDPPEPQVSVAFSRVEFEESAVAELVASAPGTVSRRLGIETRKALESISPILSISVALWLLMSNPFSKALLGRLGDRAADTVVDLFIWLKQQVVKFLKSDNRELIVCINTERNNVRLEFLLDSKMQPEVLENAIDMLPTAARAAVRFVELTDEKLQLVRIDYSYDEDQGEWRPLYALSKTVGVLAAKPTKVDTSVFGGLSIGARVRSEHLGTLGGKSKGEQGESG